MRATGRPVRTGRSAVALAALTALVVALVPATVAAQTPEARGIDRVCPPSGLEPDDGPAFNDTAGTAHEAAITCVAQYRIADGYPDGSYRPHVVINRAQMASLVRSFVETALGEELPDGDADFSDVPSDSPHAGSISAIVEAGIAGGFGDGTFRPGDPVRRDQMATFIANAIDYAVHWHVTGNQPPPTDQRFFDDTGESRHADNIDRLAAQGIVAGVGDRRYNPAGTVSRAQMATFVMRGADYLEENHAWRWSPYRFVFEPEAVSALVGTDHTLTVTVLDLDDEPLAGEEVALGSLLFNQEESSQIATATTDSAGTATFTYTGPDETDLELLVACIRPADCEDEETSTSRVFAGVFWAEHAETGDVGQNEVVVGTSTGDGWFDSLSYGSDSFQFVVRRWTHKDGDTFRDDRDDQSRVVSREEFAEAIAEPFTCLVDVESYSTTLPSTFVVTFCDDPDESSEDASQSG